EVPWHMLIVPTFYVFLLYYLRIEKKLWTFIIITSILFILELIIRSFLIKLSYYGDKSTLLIDKYTQIAEAVNAVYSTFIFIKAALVLFKYDKMYEYILSFDDIVWLKRFMQIGSFVLLFWIIAIVLNIY